MRLTYEKVCKLLSVNGISNDKKYVYADCPVCGKPEFWMLFLEDNQPCGCSRGSKCGWRGNIFTLIKLLNKSHRDFFGDREIDVFGNLKDIRLDVIESDERDYSQLPEINSPILWKRVYDHPYLRDRHFTDDQFKKYEVGVSVVNPDYVTFLVRQNGRLTGYISRSIKSKEWIDQQKKLGKDYLRYDNSGSDFSKMLYGLDEIVDGGTHTVILVEGVFSKTKTDDNLMLDYSDDVKCVATFGSKLSYYQIDLLNSRGVKNLVFWFEADVLNKIKPILSEAALYFNVKASYLYGVDPNDIDRDEAIQLWNNSVNFVQFNMNFIQPKIKA
jgi:hypothetical protein